MAGALPRLRRRRGPARTAARQHRGRRGARPPWATGCSPRSGCATSAAFPTRSTTTWRGSSSLPGRLALLQASLGRSPAGSPAPGVRAGPHGAAAVGRHRRPRRRGLLEHPPRLQERPRQRTGRPAPGPDRGPRRRAVARRVDVCAAVRPGVGSLPRRGTRGRRPGGRDPRRLHLQPGDGARRPDDARRRGEPRPGGGARRRGGPRLTTGDAAGARHARRPRRRAVHRDPRALPRTHGGGPRGRRGHRGEGRPAGRARRPTASGRDGRTRPPGRGSRSARPKPPPRRGGSSCRPSCRRG